MKERDEVKREILPILDRQHFGLTTYDAKDPDTKFPPIRDIRPPAGAPNVLIVLIDDAGFGSSSAFGGPCQTPTFEKLAANGLRYNRFHTTALCSPTRQALLTGRNHHSAGMGCITELATSAPGYSSVLPKTKAPLAMTLKLNGYATAQFGKCHEVPVWQTSPMGPFDAWPTGGGGFEYFYGFLGGETNQYDPAIYEGTVPVDPPKTAEEGYHFTEDMTDKAIAWVRQQKALMADKPFFMYFAPGATHAPHHVPKEWADKYRGKFDQGWDKLREETLARQKNLGVVPPNAELTKRPKEIPAWDEMDPMMKRVVAREMEVYAGFMEHTDHNVGRLMEALRDLEVLDDTLIYVIIGDNGASAEGGLPGTFNENIHLNGLEIETPEFLTQRIDKFGGPQAYNHYAVGWAHAMDTPYQWTKQVASHWGGTRNGTIVHWPNGIKAKSTCRPRFSRRRGFPSRASLTAFSRARSKERACSTASRTRRRRSATRRSTSRCSALIKGDSQLLFGGMGRLTENCVLTMKNKSFSITAEVEVSAESAEGVIIAQGGAFGGLSLYAKGGKATFAYNLLGLKIFTIEASQRMPAGTHQVRMEFAYDGGGLAKGGNVTLYYDGKKVGEGRVEQTVPMMFSCDETTDIGRESGTPVSPDYTRNTSVFTGKVNWVQIDLGKDDHDHLISPEERLRLAMTRQ
jgi:arylsulfatase A-like enzyme